MGAQDTQKNKFKKSELTSLTLLVLVLSILFEFFILLILVPIPLDAFNVKALIIFIIILSVAVFVATRKLKKIKRDKGVVKYKRTLLFFIVPIILIPLTHLYLTGSFEEIDFGNPRELVINTENTDSRIDISQFEYLDTTKSSFVDGAWYEKYNESLVVMLKNSYYEYCAVPVIEWEGFKVASSFGTYYNKNIKGNYSCENVRPKNTFFDGPEMIFDHIIPLTLGGSDFKSIGDEYLEDTLKNLPSYNETYKVCFSNAIQEESKILTRANYTRQEDGTWLDDEGEFPGLELQTEIEYRVSEIFFKCIK
jgi:hypothetical protein